MRFCDAKFSLFFFTPFEKKICMFRFFLLDKNALYGLTTPNDL